MSYEKQDWNVGDYITAEKLNHIEDGIEQLQNDLDETIMTGGAFFLVRCYIIEDESNNESQEDENSGVVL